MKKWLLCSLVLLCGSVLAKYETELPIDFQLQQYKGDMVSLSDYRDQWVVVNYWATWCAPCRKEMPELSSLHSDRSDVTVLGLLYEELEDTDIDSFLQEVTVAFPVLLVDVYQPPEPFGAPLGLPLTIILDKDGKAVKSFMGPVTRAAIESFIDGEPSD